MDSTHVHQDSHSGKSGDYGRFLAMIGTSTVVMYGLMYLNTYALDHVVFSQTRMWMTLCMGAMMALIILVSMLRMFANGRANIPDRRVRALADAIIEAQRGEVAEMKRQIADIEAGGDAPADIPQT